MKLTVILREGLWLCLICLTMINPVPLQSQNLTLENPIRFLALGDSYTIGQSIPTAQRWPNQLADSLESRGFTLDTLTIIATTGWRTDNLINAIKNKDLESRNYNLVSLLIGVNNQFQSRPFSQYVTEFPALLDSAIRYAGGNPDHVFVVSIPDYAFTPFGQQSSDPDEISMEIDQYNAYSRQVADSMGITYFDITPISRLGLINPSYVASDGLHPSGIQYSEWVKLMLELIDEQLTSITSDTKSSFSVLVSPNPASNVLHIEIKDQDPLDEYSFSLYNVDGSMALNEKISLGSTIISLNDLHDGLYFVRITSRHQHILKKLIIKNF